MTRRAALALCAILVACGGGSDDNDGTNPPPPPPAGFAGTYATAVTLTSTTCGPVTVQSLPTTVTHDQSSGAVSLTHGGTRYSGTVAADSTFATTPLDQDVGDGFQYRVTISGRFGNRSFAADATVDRTGGVACRYVARWVGTR
jgi:hypothetical protein